MSADSPSRVGPLLREWRKRRGRTQLDVALDAGISARHLSFLGDRPLQAKSRDGAGARRAARRSPSGSVTSYCSPPATPRQSPSARWGTPSWRQSARRLEVILTGHEPYPAVVVDRGWNLVAANAAMGVVAAWVDPALLQPPVNVMRVGLHPRGAGPLGPQPRRGASVLPWTSAAPARDHRGPRSRRAA